MITNLVASIVVSLVTNVVERVPVHDANISIVPCITTASGFVSLTNTLSGGWSQNLYSPHMVPDVDPRQKWVRTTVVRITNLSFIYDGKLYSERVGEDTMSDNEVEYALERQEKWVVKPAK